LQTAFARGIGQRLDFAVITRAAAVENDFDDAFALGGFGRQRADFFGPGRVGRQFSAAAAFLPSVEAEPASPAPRRR
jgi:hypothetical protein